MPTLVLLRHAKSSYPPGVDDHDRPLNPRGEREAPIAGREVARVLTHIGGSSPAIDVALVSTAARAQQTWQLAVEQLPPVGRNQTDPNLYLATVPELLRTIRGLPQDAQCVLVVGHNDGLERLAGELADQPVRLKTSSFAVLSSERGWASWAPATAHLETVVVAR